ncbi:MAG TPA: SDR family oxidoreductase [Acidimicrobiales bacterium]|nr:SDR family oxidoreductase [Acidimicrobiales bacterium]
MPPNQFVPHPERRPSVVAGASSGIGAAVAAALGAAGHPVVLGARRTERCEEVARRIRDGGGEAHVEHLDLADPESVEAFAAAAQKTVGPVDVMVTSAGHVRPGAALSTSPSDFAYTVAVNLLGAHRLVSAFGPAMTERHHGDLVFVSSEAVRTPRPSAAAYVASKFGLEGFVRALQLELEGTGVRATIVQPGQTLTGMGTDWDPEAATAVLEEWIRFGVARHNHFLRPAHVAAAVLAALDTPPGSHLPLIEVQPEAPIAPADPSGPAPRPGGDTP